MYELRCIRSGALGENDNMVTIHDVFDAIWALDNDKDETYLRRVVMPLEVLCLDLKRIVVKDSAVNAICYGARLMIPVIRFDYGIEIGSKVALITTKGEAVATGMAILSSFMIASCDHGAVTKTKKVIMERDMYPKRWCLGAVPQHQKWTAKGGFCQRSRQTNNSL